MMGICNPVGLEKFFRGAYTFKMSWVRIHDGVSESSKSSQYQGKTDVRVAKLTLTVISLYKFDSIKLCPCRAAQAWHPGS